MLADLVVSVPFLEIWAEQELVVAEAQAVFVAVFVVQAWVQLHLQVQLVGVHLP